MNEESLLKARPYQLKLLEKCMKKNSIVFLQTGSGKTYIAVMLIKNLSDSIRSKFSLGGKRTIFLANTVPLIQQQADVIKRFIDVDIEHYYGERVLNKERIDSWNKEMWLNEFETKQILVMSPQILVTLIEHSFISKFFYFFYKFYFNLTDISSFLFLN
jgi:endoribonuclease Dicer